LRLIAHGQLTFIGFSFWEDRASWGEAAPLYYLSMFTER
jgi:hypothetical protein